MALNLFSSPSDVHTVQGPAQWSNSSAGKSNTGCVEMEREALLKFKEDLKDPSGWLSSWVGDDCCNWIGIGCSNETGNVERIDLNSPDYCDEEFEAANYSKSCLGGTLNPSLLNLTYLNYLDLRYNYFQGTPIPEFIGSLKNLRHLDLSRASFTGMVPPSLGNLSNLLYLDLTMYSYPRKLWVSDLNWLSGLSSLQYLRLAGTDLSKVTTKGLQVVNLLPSLLELKMPSCELSVSVPKVARGNLCYLRILDLSFNDISGEIKDLIEALSGCGNITLEKLDLSSNKLGGNLPDSLGHFKHLKNLQLDDNSLVGPLPTSIGNLSLLRVLDLSFNMMTGMISENIGQLTKLYALNLFGNSWEGIITENHLQNLTGLTEFSLSSTSKSLVFSVRRDWFPLFRLSHIAISDCHLGPAFPSWLRFQAGAFQLTLSNVGISDMIPDWFWGLLSPNVWWLNLSNNQLRGELPKSINVSLGGVRIHIGFNHLEGSLPLWSNVTRLSLRNNLLTGPIPKNIGYEMSIMQDLDLSRNLLNGSIPLSMNQMRNLYFLDLSNNYLSGEIPSNWQGLKELSIVDLSNNKLSGGIPSSTCSLPRLFWLKLSRNNLSGELSISLQDCTRLVALDLGKNRFFGSITAVENLISLTYLGLRANKLTGNIPEQLCRLPSLRILDLAHNNLSGSIPRCIGNLKAFKRMGTLITFQPSTRPSLFLEHVQLVVKGRQSEFTKIIPLLNVIDLSSNNLIGEIPEEITNLSTLGALNLSWNQLTGRIPENISSLQRLESLDFSCNHLSGPIPPSMSSMTTLNHLNLSRNNLSGPIPTANQFGTFNDPSIYEGNLYLCGLPLTSNCSPVPKDEENVEDEDESEKFWFYVSMGLGFIVGFWAVCGTLVIKKSWRHAYFKFIDELKDKISVSIAVYASSLQKRAERQKIKPVARESNTVNISQQMATDDETLEKA